MTVQTAGILVYEEDSVLLVRHKNAEHRPGIYGIPAGRVIHGENLEQAAIRELEEETGLYTTAEHLIQVPKQYTATIDRPGGSVAMTLDVFVCNWWCNDLRPSTETNPEWVKLDAVQHYNLLPNVETIVRECVRYRIDDY